MAELVDGASRRPSRGPSPKARFGWITQSIVAAAIGCAGSTAAVWDHGPAQRGDLAGLFIVAVSVSAVILARRRPPWWVIGGFAVLSVAVLSTVQTVGGRTVAMVLATSALAAQCLASLSRVRPRPWSAVAVSLAAVAASGLVWAAATGRATLAFALLALAATPLLALRAGWRLESFDRVVDAQVGRAVSLARSWFRRVSGASELRHRWLARSGWVTADRWVVAAVVLGGILRLVWVVAMTRSDGGEHGFLGDWYSTWNLRIATQFASGEMPSVEGLSTAFWPPGYGAALAPSVWLSQVTGWFSANLAASLFNVAVGTLTIVACAAVARQWLGPLAAAPAAWLMAIAPDQIYISSVAVPETLIAAVLIGALWLCTALVRSHGSEVSGRWWMAVGACVGAAVLIGDRTTMLVVVPALVMRSLQGRWAGALRATAWTALGILAVLVPWTVRNGVQVGWWSPTATSIPEGMCTAKYGFDRQLLTDTADDRLLELAEDCLRNAPLDRPGLGVDAVMPPGWSFEHPDEAAYARRNLSGSIDWLLTHPEEVLRRAPGKVYDGVSGDRSGGLDIATHFDMTPLASPRSIGVYENLATAWYGFVALGAAIALVRHPGVRRAVPLWFVPLVLALQPVLGPYAFSRHFIVAHPYLVVMSAALVAGGAARAAGGVSRGGAQVRSAEGSGDSEVASPIR